MRWAATVPLIGGGVLAAKNVTQQLPQSLISYSPFAENDSNIRHYLPSVPYHVIDKPELSDSPIDLEAHRDLDFVQALCPCAGLSALSTAGKEQRDKMNFWMLETARFVTGTLKPKVFWGENAPGLFSGTGEHVRSQLYEIGKSQGYSFSVYRTSTLFHGVPQHRKRTFYFFWRDTNAPIFSEFRKPHKPLGEYMLEVPATASLHTSTDIQVARDNLANNDLVKFLKALRGDNWLAEFRQYIDEMGKAGLTVLSYINFRKWMKDAADYLEKVGATKAAKDIQRVKTKLEAGQGFWDNSHYIFSANGYFTALVFRNMNAIHPTEERELTLREAMHLMALPHDFELFTGAPNNICQNVPVCTAEDMTREVIATLAGDRDFSKTDLFMQDNLSLTSQSINSNTNKLLEF